MIPELLYQRLCNAANLEKAAFQLSDAELRELHAHLAREGAVSGIPSLVQGVLAAEAVNRFMAGGGK